MTKERRRATVLFLVFNLAILSLSFTYLILVNLYDGAVSDPTCRFQQVFSLYCPGCGGSRALRALMRLDLVSALRLHPPLVSALPLVVYAEVLLILGILRCDARYITRFKIWTLTVPVIFAVVFFFVRNALLLSGIDILGDIL